MKQPCDMYNNRIQPGDIIAYPGRLRSDIYMRTAKVMNVREREGQMVLDVVLAKPPRWWERKENRNWKTDLRKVTISVPVRTTIIPKSYIQNDKRYSCLLDI